MDEELDRLEKAIGGLREAIEELASLIGASALVGDEGGDEVP